MLARYGIDVKLVKSHSIAVMASLGKAAIALPPAALRYDLGAVLTVGKFAPSLLQNAANVIKLTGPFSRIIDDVITDSFIHG